MAIGVSSVRSAGSRPNWPPPAMAGGGAVWQRRPELAGRPERVPGGGGEQGAAGAAELGGRQVRGAAPGA
jgi:hypothetical protein